MNNTLVQEVQLVLKSFNSIAVNSDKFKELEEANNKFKKLVEEGLLKQRGNNLMSFDEKHLHKNDAYKVNF